MPVVIGFDSAEGRETKTVWIREREELLHQLEHDDVMGRTWAAGELARFVDDPTAIDGLENRADSGRFRTLTNSSGRIY